MVCDQSVTSERTPSTQGDGRDETETSGWSPKPERIQLQRTKGWRKPEKAIVVTRPGPWGNPFTIAQAQEVWFGYGATDDEARAFVVECFEDWLYKGDLSEWWFYNGVERHAWMRAHLRDLTGHDLACWCPPGARCHADVLLAAANA